MGPETAYPGCVLFPVNPAGHVVQLHEAPLPITAVLFLDL